MVICTIAVTYFTTTTKIAPKQVCDWWALFKIRVSRRYHKEGQCIGKAASAYLFFLTLPSYDYVQINFSPIWKIKHFDIRASSLILINIRVVLSFLRSVNEALCSLCSGNTFAWWCFPLAGKQIKGFSSWQTLLSIGHNYWTYLKGSFYIFWPLTFIL